MKFKELFESPVGQVGRTGINDANNHITPELEKEFFKIVKKLGGKTVAKLLLQKSNIKPAQGSIGIAVKAEINGDNTKVNVTESTESLEQINEDETENILIKHNIKIKSKFGTKFGTEYVLAKKYDKNEIKKILKDKRITFDGNSIFVS